MLKCSKEAFAACPDRKGCGYLEEATFTEGSECDKFNRQIMDKHMTNADRIRAMSDEELAELFCKCCVDAEYCEHCPAYQPNCPGESVGAWEEWLKQPAKEETT